MRETAPATEALLRFEAPVSCKEDWRLFAKMIADLAHSRWPGDLDAVRTWYAPHLERLHEDAHIRAADLLQLEQIAIGFPTRERFLTEVTLDPPNATSAEAGVPQLDEDYLTLSTIHSAKGQEWKSVYILNVVDGCIPSDMATRSTEEIDEERRLLYVAMTRAKDELHLITPQRFYTHQQSPRGDRHLYAARTRFLPDHILDRFTPVSWPLPIATNEANQNAPVGQGIDLRAHMRRMWS
jgi:DNA helicase-2/ATP-dependent DNA helicase PcrA